MNDLTFGLYCVTEPGGPIQPLAADPFPDLPGHSLCVLGELLVQAERNLLLGIKSGDYGTFGSGTYRSSKEELPVGVYYRSEPRSYDYIETGVPLTLLSGCDVGNVGGDATPKALGFVRYALAQVEDAR